MMMSVTLLLIIKIRSTLSFILSTIKENGWHHNIHFLEMFYGVFAYVYVEVISQTVRKVMLADFEVIVIFHTMKELSNVMTKFMF